MSQQKKSVRRKFRQAVFQRDHMRCRVCGVEAGREWPYPGQYLDAHHITRREEMPNGGYVLANGIALCPPCHKKAEAGDITAESLYQRIGSTKQRAIADASRA